MDNKKKKEIMKKVDHCMAEHDAERLDCIFKEIQSDFDSYDPRFVQILLGYTGVFKKTMDEWRPLFDLVEKQQDK